MNTPPDLKHDSPACIPGLFTVEVNGHAFTLADGTPTGRQILAAAGLLPADDFALLEWPAIGPTRDLGLADVIPLPQGGPTKEFLAVRGDGVKYFVLDGERFAWAGPLDAAIVRRIGRVSDDKDLWLERQDEPDRLLDLGDSIHLEHAGVERLHTRERVWILDVQGERTEWKHPDVVVRDALGRAGIDLTKNWIIFFRVKDHPPRQVTLTDTLDLRLPGIERLWVRPDTVNNGDSPAKPRREFSLLPRDEMFLSNCGYQWETIVEGERRWLVVLNYTLPAGFNRASCRVAVEIPKTYPTAQLDMFYCDPPLALSNGAAPDRTESRMSIDGVQFQRWSRHRPDGGWSASKDNLATHFGLIDASLAREVGA